MVIDGDNLSAREKLSTPERAEVKGIRGIRAGDLPFIAKWFTDPESQRHLELTFSLDFPKDWKNKVQVDRYMEQLEGYYRNQGEPNKITPIVTYNVLEDPTSVLTIRWKGDPLVPKGRIASIETFLADPELRHKGIGKQLLSSALDIIFYKYTGYSGEPADEARLWVFTDPQAGNYTIPYNFARQYGFETIKSSNWREYAERRNIPNVEDRDAMWFKLTREKWEIMKTERPELGNHAPIDLVSLRV